MFNNMPAVDFSAFAAPMKNMDLSAFAAFTAPIQKIVDLNTATFTKAFEAQKAAAENQMSLCQARAQAAMEIKDVEGLTAFVTKQTEMAQSSIQELTESTQVAAKDAQSYFTKVQAILTEGQAVVTKAAPAKKSAAKKAA
ncbi:MAG: hypothetical protein V7739_00125 [Motiliproteus sp.]